MAKIVISVRLSEDRINQVDSVAKQLKKTRTEIIDMALKAFPDLISGKGEMAYQPKWLLDCGESDARSK